jgi:hypothetical protein
LGAFDAGNQDGLRVSGAKPSFVFGRVLAHAEFSAEDGVQPESFSVGQRANLAREGEKPCLDQVNEELLSLRMLRHPPPA